MADTNTINIIDLEINQDAALKSLSDLEKQIVETKSEITDLKKKNNELATAEGDNAKATETNNKKIEARKVAVKKLNTEYNAQQKVVKDVLQTNTRELGTLEKLTLKNKELRKELRELNLETEEGTARQKEIVAEIDANTDVIKDNSDAFVQDKINVGNYQSALDGLPGSMGKTASGIKGMTAAARAFIATPLGMILAAVAVVLALVSKAFKKSQKLMDGVTKVVQTLTAAFDVIIDRISNGLEKAFGKLRDDPIQAVKDLGKAIMTNLVNRAKALPLIFQKAFEAISLRLKGHKEEAKAAAKELGQAFIQLQTGMDTEQQKKFKEGIKGITAEIKEEASAAGKLADAEAALRDLEIGLIGTVAKLTKEREKAKLATRDEALSIEERLAAQDRAIAIDKQILAAEMSAAKERARISQERTDMGKSSRDELEENARLQAEVINLESQYFTRSKELASERLSLSNQLKSAEKARTDEVAAGLLLEAQELQEFVDRELEIWALRNQSAIDNESTLTDSLIEEENERLTLLEEQRITAEDLAFENQLISAQEHELALLQIHDDTANAKADIDARYEAQRTKIEEDAKKIRVALAQAEKDAKIAFAQGFFGTIAGLASENTLAYKGATSALIAMDTYKAAMAAFSSMASIPVVGPALGVIAAAGATALGLDSIRKVWAVDEKSGASSVSAPSGGSSSVSTPTVSAASVTSTGGVVERDLSAGANVPETITEQQPVLVTDQVTLDQTNIKEIESLASN